jgi:hypothetical protein
VVERLWVFDHVGFFVFSNEGRSQLLGKSPMGKFDLAVSVTLVPQWRINVGLSELVPAGADIANRLQLGLGESGSKTVTWNVGQEQSSLVVPRGTISDSLNLTDQAGQTDHEHSDCNSF